MRKIWCKNIHTFVRYDNFRVWIFYFDSACILTSRDLELWPSNPKVDRFMPLRTTCANLHKHQFIHCQNVAFTSLVTNKRTNRQAENRPLNSASLLNVQRVWMKVQLKQSTAASCIQQPYNIQLSHCSIIHDHQQHNALFTAITTHMLNQTSHIHTVGFFQPSLTSPSSLCVRLHPQMSSFITGFSQGRLPFWCPTNTF